MVMCNSLNEPYNKPLKPAGVCNSGVHHSQMLQTQSVCFRVHGFSNE